VSADSAKTRRRLVRLSLGAGAVAVVIAVPAAAIGMAGGFGTHPGKIVNGPQHAVQLKVGQKFTLKHESGLTPADSSTDYTAYVAVAGGSEVVGIDLATDTITAVLSADTTEGVAVTPDGSQVYIAETGQYQVIAANPATGAETKIFVGAYPQDVAVSPDGSQVYATVTGGNTGPGGSNVVAVISTATNTVTGDIHVGTAPRQVAFSPDGSRAYVTTENGLDVIDTATGRVVMSVPIRSGAQGLAVSQDDTVYVTSPATNRLYKIDGATGQVIARIAVGPEPYAVGVMPDDSQAFVADMNADAVSVVDTSTDAVTATLAVGELPGMVGVVPDGSQVFVGNVLSGDATVIDPATDTVVGTILQGTGTSNLDAQPLGIAFAQS
jgi:YVTN family beta-propeller protein